MKVNHILIAVLITTFAFVVSSCANAAPPDDPVFESDSINDYVITCGTLAKVSGVEHKAVYYAEQVNPATPRSYLRALITELVGLARDAANVQGVTLAVAAGYGFENYGCNRPFI